jgi:hypothetical protein
VAYFSCSSRLSTLAALYLLFLLDLILLLIGAGEEVRFLGDECDIFSSNNETFAMENPSSSGLLFIRVYLVEYYSNIVYKKEEGEKVIKYKERIKNKNYCRIQQAVI